jgi:hypothetical protein
MGEEWKGGEGNLQGDESVHYKNDIFTSSLLGQPDRKLKATRAANLRTTTAAAALGKSLGSLASDDGEGAGLCRVKGDDTADWHWNT